MANEVRLIDANALLEVLKEEHDRVMQDPEISKAVKWGEAVINYRVLKAIEDSHTVDAVEVVHGRWELYGDDDSLSGSYFCSRCGYCLCEEEYLDQFSSLKYCPNCGSDMRGDEQCD